jgi:pyrimidine operon attenuation protein / uracil phosphoribosyltransferase
MNTRGQPGNSEDSSKSSNGSNSTEFNSQEKVIFSEEEMRRAISRIAHEIIERNAGANDLLLLGLLTRGVPLAERLSARIAEFEGVQVPTASLDSRRYRDDLPDRAARLTAPQEPLRVTVAGSVVVMVDDVLFTGRTVRAALEALLDYGRPRKVQLAVLIDRGHRELPIRADFTGKNVPTAMSESIHVRLQETDGYDAVLLSRRPE